MFVLLFCFLYIKSIYIDITMDLWRRWFSVYVEIGLYVTRKYALYYMLSTLYDKFSPCSIWLLSYLQPIIFHIVYNVDYSML